jgi:hypothetical protein
VSSAARAILLNVMATAVGNTVNRCLASCSTSRSIPPAFTERTRRSGDAPDKPFRKQHIRHTGGGFQIPSPVGWVEHRWAGA